MHLFGDTSAGANAVVQNLYMAIKERSGALYLLNLTLRTYGLYSGEISNS